MANQTKQFNYSTITEGLGKGNPNFFNGVSNATANERQDVLIRKAAGIAGLGGSFFKAIKGLNNEPTANELAELNFDRTQPSLGKRN